MDNNADNATTDPAVEQAEIVTMNYEKVNIRDQWIHVLSW